MKKSYGYIVQIEDFQLPFSLEDELSSNECGFSYHNVDVDGSGFSDYAFWGTGKPAVDKFVKKLIKKGVPSDQINVFSIIKS